MNRRKFVLSFTSVAVANAVGCTPAALVPIGGETLDAATIDKDLFALLPAGIIVFGNLDARSLFATEIGGDIASLIASVVPLGPESNFSIGRDVSRVVGGVYAMQGVDFCVAVRGNFDVAAINAAATNRATVPSGAPIVRTQYGPYQLFTVANLGFVMLTPSTMLSGNEIGMRRALDRLRYNRLGRAIPSWMIGFAESTGSVFSVAGDFGAESAPSIGPNGLLTSAPRASSAAAPILAAAAQNFPFLADLRALRVVGNFQSPGMNLAGALTYGSPERAEAGGVALRNLASMAQFAGIFSSFGFGGLPNAQIAVNGSDVGFAQPIDVGFARMAIGMLKGGLW